MSMTKPPCKPDGMADCLRRYVGCRAECEEWHKWLAIHAEEKAREKQNRQAENELLAIVSTHGERSRRAKREVYDAQRRT